MTGFWRVWLRVWSFAVIAFGVLLMTSVVPGADGPLRWVVGMMNTNDASHGSLEMNMVRFAVGLTGALTLGWGMMMLAVFSRIGQEDAPLWRSLTAAMLVWYLVDSAISVATGFPLNAVSNTVFTVLFLIPVLASGVLRGGGEPRASLA